MSILSHIWPFLALVRERNELEIKVLKMEQRALKAELELAFWKKFSGWFSVKKE